jgi:hypothetical protein
MRVKTTSLRGKSDIKSYKQLPSFIKHYAIDLTNHII